MWVIFALLDPDPMTRLNPDPIRIRIRNPAPNPTPSPVPSPVPPPPTHPPWAGRGAGSVGGCTAWWRPGSHTGASACSSRPGHTIRSSVEDPWNFGSDTDPDPRNHTSDEYIRIRILLFRPWPSRRQQQSFFANYFLNFEGTYIYIIFQR